MNKLKIVISIVALSSMASCSHFGSNRQIASDSNNVEGQRLITREIDTWAKGTEGHYDSRRDLIFGFYPYQKRCEIKVSGVPGLSSIDLTEGYMQKKGINGNLGGLYTTNSIFFRSNLSLKKSFGGILSKSAEQILELKNVRPESVEQDLQKATKDFIFQKLSVSVIGKPYNLHRIMVTAAELNKDALFGMDQMYNIYVADMVATNARFIDIKEFFNLVPEKKEAYDLYQAQCTFSKSLSKECKLMEADFSKDLPAEIINVDLGLENNGFRALKVDNLEVKVLEAYPNHVFNCPTQTREQELNDKMLKAM